jgi:glycine/D-amino acid oxidase-like deaminating enzyme
VVRKKGEAQELHIEGGGLLKVRASGEDVTCDAVVLAGAGAIALTPGGAPELLARTWTERSYGGETTGSEAAQVDAEPAALDFLPSGELDPASMANAFEERFAEAEPGRVSVRARVQGGMVAAPEREGRLWVGGVNYDAESAALLAARALGESSPGEERTRTLWEGGDGSPVVGRVPGCEGVWVACGFGASAGLFAPACAEGVAMRVLEETSGWFGERSCDPARPAVNWPSRSR